MGVKQCEEPLSKKEEKQEQDDDQDQGQEQEQEQTLAEEKEDEEDVSSCSGGEEGTQEEAEIELDRWGMGESSMFIFTPVTIVTNN